MALGDELLQSIRLPIDFAATILGQPIQPPIDPAVYADSVDRQVAAARLPNFFRDLSNQLLQAQRERDAQQQAYQQAQEQAQAAQDLADSAALDTPPEPPTYIDQTDAPTQLVQQQATGQPEATDTGEPTQVPPQPGASGSDPLMFGALQAAADAHPAPPPLAEPTSGDLTDIQRQAFNAPDATRVNLSQPPLTAADAIPPDVRNRPLSELSDDERRLLAASAEQSYAANPERVPNEQQYGGSPGSMQGTPDAGSYIHQVATDLGKVIEPIGEYGSKAIEMTPGGMGAKALGAVLPESVAGVPVKQPYETAREFANQGAAYAGADILTGGALTPVFGAQATAQAADTAQQYQRGEISGRQALTQLAMISPQLLPVVAHGVGSLSEFARTPAGRSIVEDVTQRVATGEFEHPGAIPPVEQTRAGAMAANPDLADVAAARAEARTSSPEELQRLARREGVARTQEELAIDRGETPPQNVVQFPERPAASPVTGTPSEVTGATGQLAPPTESVTVYHGTGSPTLEGGLGEGSFVTTDRAAAQKYAEVDARVRQAAGDTTAAPTVHEFTAEPGALKAAPADATNLGSPYVVDRPELITPTETAATETTPAEPQIDTTKNPLPDQLPPARGQQQLAPIGGGASAHSIPLAKGGTTTSGPEIPRELTGTQKIIRYVVRQMGGEFDPQPLRDIKTRAARTYASDMQYAAQTGRRFSKAAESIPEPVPNPATMTPRESQAFDLMNPTEKLMAALLYPDRFTVPPETEAFLNDLRGTRDAIIRQNERYGIEHEAPTPGGPNNTADPEWFPRKVSTSGGVPFDKISSSMRSRSTGDLWDFVLGGNHNIDDIGLTIGAAMEDTASARMYRGMLNDLKALGDFDGKGPTTKYAVPGSDGADGYVEVPGLSTIRGRNPYNGKMDLIRRDIVAESMRNAFSHGLPDAQRVLTQPARFIRAVNFAFGPFHAIYENAALFADNAKLFPKTVGQEIVGTFKPEARAAMIDAETPNIILSQELGAQTNFGSELRGANRAEIARAQGLPEYDNALEKLPGVGGVVKANQRWMFNWVVPWVEHQMGMGRLRSWMIDHPNLVPQDFADIMQRGDPDEIRSMVQGNPQFKAAGERIMAHVNHVTGFTENTLGQAERQAAGAYLSTPTITRAIVANVRDAFSAPGSLRGTMARQFWRNAAITMSTISVGGTLIAQGGESKYTDPTSPDFVLNPKSSNFMAVVTPNGTAYSLMPSPIRSPLKALFSGTATAGTKAVEGGSPQEVLSSGLNAQLSSSRDFINNRLSAPGRFGKEFIEQENRGSGGLGSLKAAAQTSAGGDVPLPAGPAITELAKGEVPDLRSSAEKSALSLIGGSQLGPTPYEKYNNYLESVKNPDGSPRFPDGAQTVPTSTNNFTDFVQNDPKAAELKKAYEDARLDTGSQQSQASLAIQQDRLAKLQAAQQAFDQTHDYTTFRHEVTDIRALEAQRQQDLNVGDSTAPTKDRELLNSWFTTYDKARDPITGKLDQDTLESLQTQWKQEHPDDYARLIVPNSEVGLTPLETELRKDRQTIEKTGWWDLDPQSWQMVVDEATNEGYPQFQQYPDYATYAQQKQQEYKQMVIDEGYDPSIADALAGTLWQRDPIAAAFQNVRASYRLQLEAAHPELVNLLAKWGYSTTSGAEAGIAASQFSDQTDQSQ